MARIRTVKPELFRHEGLFEADRDYQLPIRFTFIGLFTCCDREGRFKWRPQHLKLDIFPYDNVDISPILEALVERGFVHKYEYEGEWYGCIPSWLKHQRIDHREMQSHLPDPIHSFTGSLKTHTSNRLTPNVPLDTNHMQEKRGSRTREHEASAVDKTVSEMDTGTNELPANPLPKCLTILTPLPSTEGCKEHHALTKELNLDSLQNSIATEIDHSAGATISTVELPSGIPRHIKACPGMPGGNMEYGRGIGNREYGIGKREGERNNTIVASRTRPCAKGDSIHQIFEHWKTVMNHPNAKLDPKRKKLITKALGFGYGIEQLCQAIRGCSITPHNMGYNDRNQRFDGLHIILRDSDQIDRFIHNCHYPPRVITEAERRTQANVQTLQQWATQKVQEGFINAG